MWFLYTRLMYRMCLQMGMLTREILSACGNLPLRCDSLFQQATSLLSLRVM